MQWGKRDELLDWNVHDSSTMDIELARIGIANLYIAQNKSQ